MKLKKIYIMILYVVVSIFLAYAIQKFEFSISYSPELSAVFFYSVLVLIVLYGINYLLNKYGLIVKSSKKDVWLITYSLIITIAYYIVRTNIAYDGFLHFTNTEFDFLLFRLILVLFAFILSCIINAIFLAMKKSN